MEVNQQKGSGLGIASFVLGIIGFLTGIFAIGIIFDIIAIVLGLIAIAGKKNKSGFAIAGTVLSILSIILVVFVYNVFSDTAKEAPAKKVSDVVQEEVVQVSTAAVEEEKTDFGIGEVVDLNGIEATLLTVTESTGGQFTKPADGNVFVILEFDIANNSKEDITVSSMLCFEAYCDDYSVNQSMTGLMEDNGKKQLDGNVAVGKKISGVITYEVPTDWKQMEVSFTPSFWSGKAIKFIATK